MANIKEAFEYASKNPNSDFAKNLEQLARSGSLNEEAQKYGIDLSGFQPKVEEPVEKKPSIQRAAEKIADFTGGKELAQAGAVALTKPFVSKKIDETQAMQGDIQGRLIQRIKEKKALGEDTSRLETALTTLTEEMKDFGAGAEKLLNPNDLTPSKVVGDTLQLGATIAGAGTYGSAAKGMTTGVLSKAAPSVASTLTKSTGILKGAGVGALKGAGIGATGGAVQGVAQGLQENEDARGVANKALTGAIAGGVGGAVIGGVTGGISGGIKANKLSKETEHLRAVTPDVKDLSNTEYERLLNMKKITPKTKTQGSKYIMSEQEKEIAGRYKNILTNDPVKNTQNILDEIAKKDKEVGTFLKKNNGIFNTGELKNNLSKKLDEFDDLTVSDEKLAKVKKDTVNNFIKSLKKNDMESLWKARKEFDQQIEKAFSGSPTLSKEIKKGFRNAVQDFIAEKTPDAVYSTSMKDMSQLYNLKDITNQKAITEKGMNAIQLWFKRNPTKTKIAGTIAGTGALAGIGTSILKD